MPNNTAGLEGVIAGESAIATVGKEGVGLNYRGYSIEDLAAKSSFEEVAYLLIYGKLPTSSELAAYINKLTHFFIIIKKPAIFCEKILHYNLRLIIKNNIYLINLTPFFIIISK